MQKIIFALVVVLSATVLNAQSFCGEIKYNITIEDNSGRGMIDLLTTAFGTGQRFQICGDSYATYDQIDNLRSLYHAADNKYYLIGISKDATLIDGSIGGAATTNPVQKTDEKVLGHSCQKVAITTDGVTTTYYFSDDFKVNAALFSKHQFMGWAAFMTASEGALPLKIVKEYGTQKFKVTYTATETKVKRLSEKDFELPSDIVVSK